MSSDQPFSTFSRTVVQISALQPSRSRVAPLTLGTCEVFPASRTLMRDGRTIEIGSRAFDLLIALMEGRGQPVSKEEIVKAVWPTTTVIETNLRVQISCLRRALGEERWRIKNIPGRGYLIVVDGSQPRSQLSNKSRREETDATGLPVARDANEHPRPIVQAMFTGSGLASHFPAIHAGTSLVRDLRVGAIG